MPTWNSKISGSNPEKTRFFRWNLSSSEWQPTRGLPTRMIDSLPIRNPSIQVLHFFSTCSVLSSVLFQKKPVFYRTGDYYLILRKLRFRHSSPTDSPHSHYTLSMVLSWVHHIIEFGVVFRVCYGIFLHTNIYLDMKVYTLIKAWYVCILWKFLVIHFLNANNFAMWIHSEFNYSFHIRLSNIYINAIP
jgi:hypothetical protein